MEKIKYDEEIKNLLDSVEIIPKGHVKYTTRSKTDILEERIYKLEKELQTLKDNLYQVFFNEDLTNKK